MGTLECERANFWSHKDLQIIEENPDLPTILLCPINMEIIQYPVKINGRFYDIEAISEYLTVELNKNLQLIQRDILRPVLKCPLRMNIDPDLILEILHTLRSNGVDGNIHPNSVRNYFVYKIFMFRKNEDQIAYNKLITNYCELNGYGVI